MNGDAAEILRLVFVNADVFLVILTRMIGFFVLLPIFSGANVPTMSKVGLSAAISLLVFLTGQVTEVHYSPSIFGLGLLLLTELATGMIIAFVVYMMFSLFLMTGQLVDYQIGFSMVSVYDPVSQAQVPVTGNLYYLSVLVIFVQTHGLHRMVQTIFDSFEMIPPGGAEILGNATVLQIVLDMMGSFFVLSIKIALPIMATILLVDVGLGILVKAVPQMNVFVVGMPMKLFIGLVVLTLTFPILTTAYKFVFDEILVFVHNIIKGMMPS